MRSSKSRSRSKSNRNRSSSNSGASVVNRVFDSSGPDGKVRGTPQQIIDKYNQLARDAQLSNDRVAAENFQQHAEHYLRMLSEAQREIDQRREQQEREQREQRERQSNRDRDQQTGNNGGGQGGQYNDPQGDAQPRDQQPRGDHQHRGGQSGGQGQDEQPRQTSEPRAPRKPRFAAQDDVVDLSEEDGDSNIVETPENAAEAPPAPAPKPKRPRKPRVKKTDADTPVASGDEATNAAE